MGNQFEHAAGVGCLQMLLFIFNVVFWVVGLIFLIIGLWAEFGLYDYVEMAPEFSGTGPYIFIGLGILIFIVSSVAFSCILKTQAVLLYLYGGFLACILMMCIGLIATLTCFRHTYAMSLYNGLNKAVINYDHIANYFDYTQKKMRCCGVNNYTDWMRISRNRVIPSSCCVDPDNCITANYSDIHQRGCYQVITKTIDEYVNTFVFLGVATTILPTCGTLLSCFLAYAIQDAKYDMMEVEIT